MHLWSVLLFKKIKTDTKYISGIVQWHVSCDNKQKCHCGCHTSVRINNNECLARYTHLDWLLHICVFRHTCLWGHIFELGIIWSFVKAQVPTSQRIKRDTTVRHQEWTSVPGLTSSMMRVFHDDNSCSPFSASSVKSVFSASVRACSRCVVIT